MKQYVKKIFFKTSCFFFFRTQLRFILGRSQSRNQGEGAKGGASASFSQVIEKI